MSLAATSALRLMALAASRPLAFDLSDIHLSVLISRTLIRLLVAVNGKSPRTGFAKKITFHINSLHSSAQTLYPYPIKRRV